VTVLSISTDEKGRVSGAAWWIAAGAAALALVAPALWNGFPLIFPDTGGYLQRPITGTLELGRSALYGLVLLLGAPLSFWPNILAQATLIVWLIALTLRVNGIGARPGGGPWLLLGIVAALTVTTSLPWFTAQLMPDVLFPAGVLALYLLAFGGGDMRNGERIGLCAVIAFAIASHMAFIAVALGLVVALLVVSLLRNFPAPRLGFAGLALAGGLLLAPLSNLAITGKLAFTPGGASFLFNRLVEDGIVTRYLDEICPDETLRICPYRNEITTEYDDWLWRNDTPFWKLGGWKDYSSEERRIILATIARHPLEHLTNAVAHSADQLVSFATELATDDGTNAHTIYTFREYLPRLYPALMTAKQQTGGIDVDPLNVIHIPVAALSMLALAGLVIFRRRLGLTPQATALAATVLLALLVNAAVCGVFSHAAERYQSRLISLAPLALITLLVARRRVW
jgi:hypothetical protein